MNLKHIFEANLPLRKGAIANARGNYDALICVMNPIDFIRLTTEDEESLNRIFTDEFSSLDDFNKEGSTYNKNSYNMPFLKVIHETGKVLGHEGRHRAAMIAKAGGKSFPCTIAFATNYTYEVSWSESDFAHEDADDVEKVQNFETIEDAREFVKKLEALNNRDDLTIFYSNVKLQVDGGSRMKGSPRSEGWNYKPWSVSDVPAQFIGEFNPAMIIPTSKMRFGLVKGYRHYR